MFGYGAFGIEAFGINYQSDPVPPSDYIIDASLVPLRQTVVFEGSKRVVEFEGNRRIVEFE